MRLKEGYIILIIRPFSKEIEGSIKERIHDSKQPGEIPLLEEGEDDEKKTDWSVESHSEDKRLYLITNISDGIDSLSYI